MYTGTTVLGDFSELKYSLSPSYQAARLLVNIELHCFSDSSELAYAGCIYLKFILSSGAFKVTLVEKNKNCAETRKLRYQDLNYLETYC